MFYPLGDRAVTIVLGDSLDQLTHLKVKRLYTYMLQHRLPGIEDVVPAYTTVTLHYHPCHIVQTEDESAYEKVCAYVRRCLQQLEQLEQTEQAGLGMDGLGMDGRGQSGLGDAEQADAERVIHIPVCYDAEFAPDLPFVANHNHLDIHDVISIHAGGQYTVSMIGFTPGFPYLSGMSERIATPRKLHPSGKVAAGSVGIAGRQTGIYPLSTPGGWQIIGRTPLTLFDPLRQPPSLLQFGDVVRFYPITRHEFQTWEEQTR